MQTIREELSELSAVVRITLQPEDYTDKVNSALVEYRKKASMPGFRPGKVPMGLVKKMYGKSAKADEINKLLSQELQDYINREGLEILGNPLPKDDDAISEDDWNNDVEYNFEYEIGLAPKVEVDLESLPEQTRYKITASEEMVDNYVNDLTRRFGKMSASEEVSEKDIVRGNLVQLDVNGEVVEGGISKDASVVVEMLGEEGLKSDILGKKVGDMITAEPKAFAKTEAEAANMLGISVEELNELQGNIQMTVAEITHMEPAEINQELFDKAYGEGAVSSEEELRERAKGEIEGYYQQNAENKFKEDLISGLIEMIPFQLPDSFLKKWMKTASENPVSDEDIENDYPNYERSMKWSLIQNEIIKANDIKVEREEAEALTGQLINQNMAQYGQPPLEGEDLQGAVMSVLSKQDEMRRVYEMLFDQKILDLVNEKTKIEEKEISFDDFIKLVSDK